jgi:putative ABC transport system ATP-binding protein
VIVMIHLEAVTKTYEMGASKVNALDNVTLRIRDGDFLSVIGPSGCGKSSLLFVTAGLLTPTSGTVTLDGTSLYELTAKERAKLRRKMIGFVFQSYELIPYLTALENVALPLHLLGLPSKEQEERAVAALKSVGLELRMQHRPGELSGGEQQRVSIARALVKSPKLLLADEPTGNLDQKTGKEVMDLLAQLNESQGITLVLATHDPDKARRAARIIEMKDGQAREIER